MSAQSRCMREITASTDAALAQVERVAQAACVRLFAATRGLLGFAALAWLVALALLWMWAAAPQPRHLPAAGLLLGSLVTGLAALYYGARVCLDASLFALLGETGPVSETEFAGGMNLFLSWLYARTVPGGALGPRFAGALRLWRRLAVSLGLQTMLLAGAAGAAYAAVLVPV